MSIEASSRHDCDVLVIGALAGIDLIFAEHLARRGLRCRVARKPPDEGRPNPMAGWTEYHTHISSRDVVFYQSPIEFLRLARRSRAIVSFTGSLIFALKWLWPLRRVLALPPIINFCSGSDIMELATQRSLLGWVYRQYLRSADLNSSQLSPHALKNLVELRVPNLVFLRFPYYIGPLVPATATTTGRLRFFHASHLDWKVSDPGAHRYSAKGNDRFFRAFARAVRDGLDAECVVLDRGPDRDVARNLVREQRIEDRVDWRPPLSRRELFAEFEKADVVVDQFDVGTLGGIAAEAMSLGKPVMLYVNENAARVAYPELTPVLNCHTEDEIYAELMKCRDRAYLRKVGARAAEWMRKYHSWESCLDPFLFYYTWLTGHRIVDYGWDRDPYGDHRA